VLKALIRSEIIAGPSRFVVIKIHLNPQNTTISPLLFSLQAWRGFENETVRQTTLTDHNGPEVKEWLLESWQICKYRSKNENGES
jgi:hypothetical protein